MNIIPGSQFRDCSSGDFEHYFSNTILLWNLSPTKKRIYICSEVSGGRLHGNYLTRQKELKEKTFEFQTWWHLLDVIPPYGISFSLGKCSATWYPSMAKNLKKSFPTIENTATGSFSILGSPQAEEITVQSILAGAFSKFYSPVGMLSMGEALSLEGYTSVATEGGFSIDFTKNNIYLKNTIIGSLSSLKKPYKYIVVKTPLAKEVLVDVGMVPPERVEVSL